MGAIAEGLVSGMPTPTKTYRGAPGEAERLSLGIEDLKITFHAYRSVAVNGDSRRCHFLSRELKSMPALTHGANGIGNGPAIMQRVAHAIGILGRRSILWNGRIDLVGPR